MTNLILTLRAYKSDVEIHKHSAYQIVLSEDEPFNTICENKNHINIYGFAIKPQIAHSCQCSKSNLVILNIEPYSTLGNTLLRKIGEDKRSVHFTSQQEISDFFHTHNSKSAIADFIHNNKNNLPLKSDERVNKTIAFINENFNSDKFTLDELSGKIFLSASRLGFLFREQTGSSIFKYLLWTRLRYAISQILAGNNKSLTEIAYESGFYDSSQMTKYMYEMFGISPSRLRQKSDLIQFLL